MLQPELHTSGQLDGHHQALSTTIRSGRAPSMPSRRAACWPRVTGIACNTLLPVVVTIREMPNDTQGTYVLRLDLLLEDFRRLLLSLSLSFFSFLDLLFLPLSPWCRLSLSSRSEALSPFSRALSALSPRGLRGSSACLAEGSASAGLGAGSAAGDLAEGWAWAAPAGSRLRDRWMSVAWMLLLAARLVHAKARWILHPAAKLSARASKAQGEQLRCSRAGAKQQRSGADSAPGK